VSLKNYWRKAEALHSGRLPKPETDVVQVREVLNTFLAAKYSLLESGELS
jgi:hypothetical protein